VKEELTDPESARFTVSQVPSTADKYCAYVNSKTPQGGYGGRSVFSVDLVRNAKGRITGASNATIIDHDDDLTAYRKKRDCAGYGYPAL